MITYILVSLLCLIVARFGYLTLKYKSIAKRISALPRLPYFLPIVAYYKTKTAYDSFHYKLFDENDSPYPAIFAGPAFGGEPRIFISDVDAIKEGLTNPAKYPKYYGFYDIVEGFIGNGLVCSSGEIYKRHRKLITPLFHYGSLKAMNETINDIAKQEVQNLKAGKVLDGKFIEEWTMRIIISVAFGGGFDYKWMASTYHEYIALLSKLLLGDFLMGSLAWSFPFPFNIKRWSLRKKLESKITEISNKRRQELKSGTIRKGEEVKDLLTLLIMHDDENPEITIIDEGLTFLFAGFDTTSKLLQWSFYFLAKYPDIQSKVRNEVEQVMGSNNEISDEDLPKLVYTKNTLLEALRLRPPVPVLHRTVSQDCTMAGVFCPKGTNIALYLHGAHLDPKNWNKPREFMPERWEGNPERHNFAFIPFSAGERNCIGQKLAIQEAAVILAHIIKNFRITSPNLDEVKMGMDALLTPIGLKVTFVDV